MNRGLFSNNNRVDGDYRDGTTAYRPASGNNRLGKEWTSTQAVVVNSQNNRQYYLGDKNSAPTLFWTTATQSTQSFGTVFAIPGLMVGTPINSTSIRTSTDGIAWVTQISGDRIIRAISYNNNTWVAGDDGGRIRTSTDAITWTTRTSNFAAALGSRTRALVYGNDIWVAAAGGVINTSTDGINWTFRNQGNTQNFWSSGFGNGVFVVGGQNGALITSTDGISWTSRTSNAPAVIHSVEYDNNLWVAGGQNGYIATSTDTVTWVSQQSNFGNTVVRKVAYGNGLWVAGGYGGNIRTSTDAITWVTQTSNFVDNPVLGLDYGANIWVATAGNSIRHSTDAITWTTSGGTDPTYNTKILFANGSWMAYGYGGVNLQTSTDAITWTAQITNMPTTILAAGAKSTGGAQWVVSGYYGHTRSSTDSITWATSGGVISSPIETSIRSIGFGNGTWVIAGGYGQMRISTDTITWTTVQPNVDSQSFQSRIDSVAFGNGLWLAVGRQSIMRSSTDAVTWVTVQRPTNIHPDLASVAYGNGLWVVGAYSMTNSNNAIMVSTDTLTWTLQRMPDVLRVSDVAFENNMWAIGGYSSSGPFVSLSQTASDWVTQSVNMRNLAGSTGVRSIAFSDNTWVAAGQDGLRKASTAYIATTPLDLVFGAQSGASVKAT